jgi:hypothetical protein
MSYPQDVPDDALCVFYRANNGKKGEYFIWFRESRQGSNRVRRVYWYALGNCGCVDTAVEATYAAKKWIADGLAANTPPPKHPSVMITGE